MSQALYRKYRSRSLDEIVGQDHITSLLKKAIANDSVSHAYLLTGPRGVGKTSIARIIAHAINNLEYSDESQHLDIIEIDAASNNGIEDVRDLREKVYIAPSSAARKIYIIDEVHMLSKPAFNALLKTLEEPPEHVVFILATTNVDKLPGTIISRVQRFNFRAISDEDAVRHLRSIANKESIDITDDALSLIAKHGRGSFRDSIGILDQLRHISDKAITLQDAQSALGITSSDTIRELIDAYRHGDLPRLKTIVATLENSGAQASIVASQLIDEIHSGITEHPEELDLLDSLLDVASSSHPYIKLLSVLAINAKPRQSTLSVSMEIAERSFGRKDTPVIDEGVEESKAPKRPGLQPSDTEGSAFPAELDQESSNLRSSEPDEADGRKAGRISKQRNQAAEQTTNSFEPGSKNTEMDWTKLLETLKPDVALSSLLTKCTHATDGGKLIIYAGNKFNAGRLSGPKQLPKLNEALDKLGYANLELVIKPEKAPPRDSHLAEVAAIMGGGEEVELKDG